MKHWLDDSSFRSLVKNSSYLAISRAVAGVAVLATLALAGRGLGVALFGLLVLIHSYAQAASGITKFQSWQLVVRYGGPAIVAGDLPTFQRATGFAFALDVTSGILGMVLAMALLPLLAGWFKIPPVHVPLAIAYCALLPTMAAAAPSGVLRVLDRFDLLSWQGVMQPISRAVLTLGAWAMELPFPAYVAIWFATDLAGDLFLWFLAIRELKRRDLLAGIRPTLSASGLPRVWRFAVNVNLTASLNAAWGPAARLLIGALLSPAAAGLYRVAHSLADTAQRPTDLLGKAFYPEVMRLDPGTRKAWRLMLRGMALSTLLGLAACLIVALLGKQLLELLFGAEFVPAYPVLVVLIGAPLLAMVSFPMTPMLYALDRARVPLIASAIGALVYVAAIFPLAAEFGLIGAGAAFVAGKAVVVLILTTTLVREHRGLLAQ